MPWKKFGESNMVIPNNADPLRMVNAVNDNFRNFMQSMFSDYSSMMPNPSDLPRTWGLDVDEGDNHVTVRAELPGFDVADLDVRVQDNVLTIEAKHGEEKDKHFRHVRRSLTLPGNLNTDSIDANYKNGVLELTIPRNSEKQGKKIEVKAAEG